MMGPLVYFTASIVALIAILISIFFSLSNTTSTGSATNGGKNINSFLDVVISTITRTSPSVSTPSVIGAVFTLPLQKHDGNPTTSIQFPLVSLGLQTYDTDEIAYDLTRVALQAGIRHLMVDTQHQTAVAQALVDSKIDRQHMFITGCVPSRWNNNNNADNDEKEDLYFHDDKEEDAYEWTWSICQAQTKLFAAGGIHYLDQLLLDHPPPGIKNSCQYIRDQWRALEEMVIKYGQVRSLAVSNFSPIQLDCLLHQSVQIKPVVNQLPYSVAYHHHHHDIIQENQQRGVLVQAWSPLGGSNNKFNDEIRAACANVGGKHGKSFAQVALRWILQKGAAFTTHSTKREHMEENLDIFDFELSPQDMAYLDSLATVSSSTSMM
jgi:diketogulonate reductase-like aldo/keto reductase